MADEHVQEDAPSWAWSENGSYFFYTEELGLLNIEKPNYEALVADPIKSGGVIDGKPPHLS